MSLLCLYVFQSVVFPTSYRMEYGVYLSGADCGEDLLRRLSADELYRCVRMDSMEELKREVRSGRLDCGFVLDERLNTVTDLSEMESLIDYISSTSTTKGPILKEKVFAAFLMSAAEQSLAAYTKNGKVFAEESDALTAELTDAFRGILDRGETLQVVFQTVDADGTADTAVAAAAEYSFSDVSLMDRFLALCGTLVFIAAVIFGRTRFSSSCRRMTLAFRGPDRVLWPFLSILVPVMLVDLAVTAGYLAGCGSFGSLTPLSAVRALVSFFLYGLLCSAWAGLYSLCFRKEAMYLGSIVGVIVLSLLTCRPFVRIGMFLPVLDVLKYLFPVNYLLM